MQDSQFSTSININLHKFLFAVIKQYSWVTANYEFHDFIHTLISPILNMSE